jgi:hypothetical protein
VSDGILLYVFIYMLAQRDDPTQDFLNKLSSNFQKITTKFECDEMRE